jgi:hypothetical protein
MVDVRAGGFEVICNETGSPAPGLFIPNPGSLESVSQKKKQLTPCAVG